MTRLYLTSRGATDREAFTLVEVVASAAVISVLFAVMIPLLQHVRVLRQHAEHETIAVLEAGNVMEQVAAAAAASELTLQFLEGLELSPAAERLPSASLTVSTSEAAAPLFDTRVSVSVGWIRESGEMAAPATVIAWFPMPGDSR